MIHLSQIEPEHILKDAERWYPLQQRIDDAKIGDTIELPPERLRLHSLLINKPLTIIGKPGTVLELLGGSIVVDFNAKGHPEKQ